MTRSVSSWSTNRLVSANRTARRAASQLTISITPMDSAFRIRWPSSTHLGTATPEVSKKIKRSPRWFANFSMTKTEFKNLTSLVSLSRFLCRGWHPLWDTSSIRCSPYLTKASRRVLHSYWRFPIANFLPSWKPLSKLIFRVWLTLRPDIPLIINLTIPPSSVGTGKVDIIRLTSSTNSSGTWE